MPAEESRVDHQGGHPDPDGGQTRQGGEDDADGEQGAAQDFDHAPSLPQEGLMHQLGTVCVWFHAWLAAIAYRGPRG